MKGEMAVIDGSGDTKILWSADNPVEVEAARATFDKLKAKGYIAYKVKRDGTQGEVVTSFDPDAEKLILAPAVAGG